MTRTLVTTALLLLATQVAGAPVTMLLESDEDRAAGSEIFLAGFNNFADLRSSTFANSGFSQFDVGANFSVGGLTWDGAAYQALLESDDDRDAGTEVFLATFNTFADLNAGNLAGGAFSQLNVGPNFSIGGVAWDGMAYRVLLESDDDRDGGSEVFMASFASLADLLSSNFAGAAFSQLNVGANFSVGGLAFDGAAYQILLESDDDRDAGSEVFQLSFNSFDDLLSSTIGDAGFSQLDIGPNFSIGALAYQPEVLPPVDPVPEPASLALLGGGILGLGFRRSTRAGRVCKSV